MIQKGEHILISKGQEIIILHAEHKTGFILNALLEQKDKIAWDDYHDQTNSRNKMNIH